MGNTEQKPLLQEYISNGQSRLVAASTDVIDGNGSKTKNWYLDGIFLQGEVENLNNRIYPRHEIENAVEQLNSLIKADGAVLGELDHPDTLVINIHNVSHIITEMRMDGNNGIGRMKILSNVPSGKIVEGLLMGGVPLGVSSRGSGEVDDYTREVSNFDIVTIDIVATPSAREARPTPVYEQLQKGRGRKLLNNAQDCILNKNKYTDELNSDIVSWLRSWEPNRY